MARGQRDRTRERYWRQHVEAWRRRAQSVRAYCAAEGVSEPSFYAWRRALAERDSRGAMTSEGVEDARATPESSVADAAEMSPFVPVRLVEDATPTAAVEVVLRGGRVVRVAAGFAAKTLREVVAALEDLPC